jgi:hypothetical protein
MPRKKAPSVDEAVLFDAARQGLDGVAKPSEIGTFLSPQESDGVWTVRAESTQPGYPGWWWTVSLTPAEDGSWTVTEVNLLPGEGALLVPDWVPWSDRLEEYRRSEEERLLALESEDDGDDEEGDDDDPDDEDVDDVLDGIDIDELDLDPSLLEVPDEPNDVFDHVDFDDED